MKIDLESPMAEPKITKLSKTAKNSSDNVHNNKLLYKFQNLPIDLSTEREKRGGKKGEKIH